MKGLLKYIFLPLFAVALVGCSEDYDADTAVSPYEPAPGRRLVAQVKTTNNIDGRVYSWEHNFTYDAHGRIKEINSNIVHHRAVAFENTVRYYLCNITSRANYYYFDDKFSVEYSISREYPSYPEWNSKNPESGKGDGIFNKNGTLAKYSALDFSYSTTQLLRAHTESGHVYEIKRGGGNVTGYAVYGITDDGSDTIIFDRSNDYRYSPIQNNTNFDFSGYFGYWGLEQALPIIDVEYYAPYQLTAFGFMGATSKNLPLSILSRDSKGNVVRDANGSPVYLTGKWELDDKGSPALFVDGTGRRTEIRYVE